MNKKRLLFTTGLLLAHFTLLGCQDTPKETTEPSAPAEESSNYPLEGEECSFFCGGPACNQACQDDVIYLCQSDDQWHVHEDCAEQGKSCAATEPDTADGGYILYCE